GPALAGGAPACAAAASGAPHAALVVDTGSDVTTYCVALGAPSITGIQLIQKAGQQFGLIYRLGFGGQAVCMLNGVGGPSGDDCLTGQSEYWGYWIGDGSDGWTWSSTGAASATVGDGDVQGWAWGVGIDGTTHPQPPPTSLGDVCGDPSPSPRPPPGNGGGGGNVGGGGGGNASSPSPHSSPTSPGAGTPSARPSKHHGSPSPRAHIAAAQTPSPREDATQIAASGPLASTDPGGFPVGVVMAFVLIATLGIGGWLRVRSGRSTAER
ncbi:MAG: hypothetical protein QOG88_1893, partial [Actinomycetota bacterium]|nr:hypothetical protein [Actinomycetota bacterium]